MERGKAFFSLNEIKTGSSIGRKCYRDVALCVSLLISDVLYMLL